MRTINYIKGMILVGFTMMFTSCYEMDLYPKDQLGPDNFWKTERDIQMGVAGVYSQMKAGYKDDWRYYYDAITDNGFNFQPSHTFFRSIQQGDLEPTTGGIASDVYNGNYVGIAACNNFLKNYSMAKENSKLAEDKANEYEAEVKFLRAWCYFELVRCYGDIPLYKEAIESVESAKVKQSPASEVYTFINEDLDFAIQHLPDVAYGSGHAVKGSALGLKAQVALFCSEWDTVESATKEIISSGEYALADTYESIFIKREGQKNNPEILFSVTYLNPDYKHTMLEQWGYMWNSLVPLDDLTAAYDVEKDKRVEAWYTWVGVGESTWKNPFGKMAKVEEASRTGWMLIKHFDKNDPARYELGPYDLYTDNDIIIIRYADIYLMYIEALVEKGGGVTSDPSAVKYMNEIRTRAGLSEVALVTREELRLERRRELAFEGYRYFDLLRWHIMKEEMSNLVTPGGSCKFEDRSYVWPFPQSEMDVNPNLDQKPGYN